MDNLTLSIVFPTRNAEKYLPYSLDCLKTQTVQPEEILICVGKSEDRTEEIILYFQKNSVVPVRVFYDREGLGTGYAMNLLVSNAKSDIILWASSDVVKPKNWIETVLRFYSEDVNLVYLTTNELELNDKKINTKISMVEDKHISKIKYNNNNILNVSGLSSFRRKNVLVVGNFDPFFIRGQDLDMTIRLVLSGARGGEESSMGVHFGVYGYSNLMKALKNGTYFKFIYKYGYKYISIIPHHTLAFLIRSLFLLSFISLLLSYILSIQYIIHISIYSLVLSLFSIVLGLYITHGRININLILLQILGGVGDYYQIYLLIKNKNKLPMGYGIKKYGDL
jgi:glycosyltransferase involved in cell wall biosynthesis